MHKPVLTADVTFVGEHWLVGARLRPPGVCIQLHTHSRTPLGHSPRTLTPMSGFALGAAAGHEYRECRDSDRRRASPLHWLPSGAGMSLRPTATAPGAARYRRPGGPWSGPPLDRALPLEGMGPDRL